MITSSQNVGQGMAAATMMLLPILFVLSFIGIVMLAPQARAEASGMTRRRRRHRQMPRAVARWGVEPSGPKPKRLLAGAHRHLRVPDRSRRLFFLIPLYVMVVTSLKGMPEIRLGHLFDFPRKITFQPWADAWLHACTGRDCFGLHPGLPQLGEDHRAERDHLDRHRIAQRLRAVLLALQGRRTSSSACSCSARSCPTRW